MSTSLSLSHCPCGAVLLLLLFPVLITFRSTSMVSWALLQSYMDRNKPAPLIPITVVILLGRDLKKYNNVLKGLVQ